MARSVESAVFRAAAAGYGKLLIHAVWKRFELLASRRGVGSLSGQRSQIEWVALDLSKSAQYVLGDAT